MRSWSAIFGEGDSRYGAEASGVPDERPIWEYTATQDGAFPSAFSIVVDGASICFLGRKSRIGKIDIASGALSWLVCYPYASSAELVSNGKHLVVEPYILDVNSGRVLLDYGSLFEDYQPVKRNSCSINSRFMVKGWEEFTESTDVLVVDLERMEGKRVANAVRYPKLIGESSEVVGFLDDGIARVDLGTGAMVWKSCVDWTDPLLRFSAAINDDVVTVVRHNLLYCFNLATGEEISRIDFNDITGCPSKRYNFAFTEKEVYIQSLGGSADLIGYDYRRGDVFLRESLNDLRDFCIAGDLLFGIVYSKGHGDDDNDSGKLFAIDRFNAKSVWVAAEPLYTATGVRACGDKVLFNPIAGGLRCYQWESLYRSAGRL